MDEERHGDAPRPGDFGWEPPSEADAGLGGPAWDIDAFFKSMLALGVRRGGRRREADAAVTAYLQSEEGKAHWPDAPFLFRRAKLFLALQDGGHAPVFVPGPRRGFWCEACGRSATWRRGRYRGDLTPQTRCRPGPT